MAFNINQRLNGLTPLSYLGDNAVQPPEFVTKARPPTLNDSKNFYLGDIWLDTTGYPGTLPKSENVWMLVALVGNQATWVHFGAGGLETLTGNSGGPVFPDVNDNINVLGDTTTINVLGVPGTNTLTISTVGTGVISTLTGNSGGAVSPLAGNINVVGTGVITVVGNPGTHTLTVTPSGSIASSFPTDAGTATPAVGVLNVFGGTAGRDINTTGSGNTVRVHLNNTISVGDLVNVTGADAITVSTGDVTISNGRLNLAVTNAAGTIGMITSSGNRFIHNFGTANTFVGFLAGNTTLTVGSATNNTTLGILSGTAITTASGSVFVGGAAGLRVTTGNDNTAVGSNSMAASGVAGVTTGGQNTALGNDTLWQIDSGSRNLALGNQAGSTLTTTDSDNVLIHSNGVVGDNHIMRIGRGTGAGNYQLAKTFISGIRGITTDVNDAVAVLVDSANQLGTVSSSARYKENIEPMGVYSNVLMQLRPVVFNYKKHLPETISVGLIAEEVAAVEPALVVYDKDGLPETVKYHDLVPMLLNELQKVQQNLLNSNLLIDELTKRVQLLEAK